MRTAKNILLFVFILIISLNVTVYAQENGEKTENPVKVTQESENDKDVPFTNSKGETVYTLSTMVIRHANKWNISDFNLDYSSNVTTNGNIFSIIHNIRRFGVSSKNCI